MDPVIWLINAHSLRLCWEHFIEGAFFSGQILIVRMRLFDYWVQELDVDTICLVLSG